MSQPQKIPPGMVWAYDIVAQHAAGTFRGGKYAVKLAQSLVDERSALDGIKGGGLPPRPGQIMSERDAQAMLTQSLEARP